VNYRATSFATAVSGATKFPMSKDGRQTSQSNSPLLTNEVGALPQTGTLSDEMREVAIQSAGSLMQKFVEAGDMERAQWALRSMKSLIQGRSPEQVARMEQERGLS
jgi:hypothetical protein